MIKNVLPIVREGLKAFGDKGGSRDMPWHVPTTNM